MINRGSGDYLDLNERPEEPAGPFKEEWNNFIGRYDVMTMTGPGRAMEVMKKNGYLYLDYMKLSEHLPGLFFTAGGEALDFRGEQPTWRNIKLQKVVAEDVEGK